jgi:hypothetical protein
VVFKFLSYKFRFAFILFVYNLFAGVAVEGPRSEGLLQGAPDGHLRERGGGGGRGVRLRLGGGLPGGLLLASEDQVPAQSGRKQLTGQVAGRQTR